MKRNDVKKCQEHSALKTLSLRDLQRVRGAITQDNVPAELLQSYFIKH
jgi:hypothetical protein